MRSRNDIATTMRKCFRIIHRDLSFLFTGVIIVYAVSGIALNHKRTFNADYKISKSELQLPGKFPQTQQVGKEQVLEFLKTVDEGEAYMKHYYSGEQQLKVFLKGGSSLVVDMNNGKAVYESVKKRPILSRFSRLHYNPDRWWTWFSDIFAASLLVIALTGVFMNKGKNGIVGRGGIELIIGILIPVIFLFMH